MLYEVRRDQDTARTQHAVYLPKHLLRIRDDVQGVRDDYCVKGIINIRQVHGIGNLKGEIWRVPALPGFSDHAVGIVCGDHPIRRRRHVLGQKSRAGCQLQHLFIPYHFRDTGVHIVIDLLIGLHSPLIERCIQIPGLFLHMMLTPPGLSASLH